MVKQQEKKRSGYQKKLEASSKPHALVGYERDFTYRLYDHTAKKVIISREVMFDETKSITGIVKQTTYAGLDEAIDTIRWVSIGDSENSAGDDESDDDSKALDEGDDDTAEQYEDVAEETAQPESETEPQPEPERRQYNSRSRTRKAMAV